MITVKNSVGEVVCLLTSGVQEDVKTYEGIDYVIREVLDEDKISRSAGEICGGIQNKPEMLKDANTIMHIALPYYSGLMVRIRFTGANFDTIAFQRLDVQLQVAIADTVNSYYNRGYCVNKKEKQAELCMIASRIERKVAALESRVAEEVTEYRV